MVTKKLSRFHVKINTMLVHVLFYFAQLSFECDNKNMEGTLDGIK